MTLTPETILALGEKVVLPIVTAFLAYMQSKCRKDLDYAHSKIRELQGQGPGLIRKRSPLGRMFYRGKRHGSDRPDS